MTVFQTPVLVGREDILAEFTNALDRGRPQLILLRGELSVGKSTLLAACERAAAEREWRTLRGDGRGPLSVHPKTSRTAFAERVRELLGLSAQRQSPQADTATPAHPRHDAARGHDFAADLRRTAPVVLMLDGYDPSETFHGTFAGEFMPGLRTTGAAVVVVIGETPSCLERHPLDADVVLDVEPPDTSAIRRHFEAIGRELDPAPEPGEVERWSESAAEHLDLIDPLTRALALAARDSADAHVRHG